MVFIEPSLILRFCPNFDDKNCDNANEILTQYSNTVQPVVKLMKDIK